MKKNLSLFHCPDGQQRFHELPCIFFEFGQKLLVKPSDLRVVCLHVLVRFRKLMHLYSVAKMDCRYLRST